MIEVSNIEARELICSTCGFVNMVGEKYCSECGGPLKTLSGKNAPVSADPADSPVPPQESTGVLSADALPDAPTPESTPPARPMSERSKKWLEHYKDKQVKCRYCDAKNVFGNKYCHECGAPLISHTNPNHNAKVTRSAVQSQQKYKPKDEDSGPTLLPANSVLQGRYHITRLIGQGGMGAIYLADDSRFSQRVAVVKEMLDHFTDPEQRRIATENFDREAEMLANLTHPGIPEVYDRFTEGNRHYLVMEFIDGDDLEQRLMDQDDLPFEEQEVLDWAIQICDILSYMHDQDPPIIYRDMKPANLILNSRGKIYVVDFGIARHFNPKKKGTMIGTQGYAPPEQYRGQVEPRSDLYALAATMHHLLSGRDPQAEAPFSYPPLRELNPAISGSLEKIIMRCLSMESEARYRNAQELKAAFMRIKATDSAHPITGTVPIQSRGISTALMKLGFSHKLFSAEWLLRINIVLLMIIVTLLIMLLAKN